MAIKAKWYMTILFNLYFGFAQFSQTPCMVCVCARASACTQDEPNFKYEFKTTRKQFSLPEMCSQTLLSKDIEFRSYRATRMNNVCRNNPS